MAATVSGETDLAALLSGLSPVAMPGNYVYCTFSGATYGDYTDLLPLASIQEEEGLTLILPQTKADAAQLSYAGVFCRITLTVHSSLAAVGLTAAVATALAAHGISANPVAGYYHDHILVPLEQGAEALLVLTSLAG